MKILTVNPDKCTGCRTCELACSLKHTREFNPARSRVQVIGSGEVFSLPMMCYQCERPYCMQICPSGAISKQPETGMVVISSEKCIGCKMCLIACPFGNVTFSSEDRRAVKCDLCDGDPECVAFCPTGALEFKEADIATMTKRRAVSEKLKEVIGRIE